MPPASNPPQQKKAGYYFVYIVRCNDGTFYTGYAVDLQKRIVVHNTGKGAKYTRSRLPVTLVFRRRFRTSGEALSAEARIKQLSRTEKETLILKPRRKIP